MCERIQNFYPPRGQKFFVPADLRQRYAVFQFLCDVYICIFLSFYRGRFSSNFCIIRAIPATYTFCLPHGPAIFLRHAFPPCVYCTADFKGFHTNFICRFFFCRPTVFSLSRTGSSLFREPCSSNQRKIYYIYLVFQRAGHIQQIPGNLFLCIADILYDGSFQQKWFFRVFIKHNFSIMVVCQAGTFALDRSGSFFTGFIKESFFFFLSSRCVFMHWIFLFSQPVCPVTASEVSLFPSFSVRRSCMHFLSIRCPVCLKDCFIPVRSAESALKIIHYNVRILWSAFMYCIFSLLTYG